jgi:hypothetical protein
VAIERPIDLRAISSARSTSGPLRRSIRQRRVILDASLTALRNLSSPVERHSLNDAMRA